MLWCILSAFKTTESILVTMICPAAAMKMQMYLVIAMALIPDAGSRDLKVYLSAVCCFLIFLDMTGLTKELW